ncbi:MAG: phosphoribosyl-ATP diphosphatase [Candidatus Onthomonas sp.]
MQSALEAQYQVTLARKQGGGEKSYTCHLYRAGLDKILKKCGEETFEAVIAAKGEDNAETVGEINDVLYHVTVLLCQQEVSFPSMLEALNLRCQTQGQPVDELYQVIDARSREAVTEDGSHYTAYLFQQGLDKILKKVGEACSLLLIAGKAGDREAMASEAANLLYHLLAMMLAKGITPADVEAELDRRSQKEGNLKQVHTTDQTT